MRLFISKIRKRSQNRLFLDKRTTKKGKSTKPSKKNTCFLKGETQVPTGNASCTDRFSKHFLKKNHGLVPEFKLKLNAKSKNQLLEYSKNPKQNPLFPAISRSNPQKGFKLKSKKQRKASPEQKTPTEGGAPLFTSKTQHKYGLKKRQKG